MAYQRRIIDDMLDEVFPHLAAISLEGAKGVGKTATAGQRARSTFSLQRPEQLEAVLASPDLIVQADTPVFIDEWQLAPTVWDRVRTAVDDDATGGQFLLAGSAGVREGTRIHSGAGRIVSLRLRPLSLVERRVADPTVSLHTLLEGHTPDIGGQTTVDLHQYVEEILRSGFPGIRGLPERARNLQLDSYVNRVVDRELPENGVIFRRPAALRAWLAAYGASTSSDAAYSTILDAATARESNKPARATVDAYREHLTRLYLLDPVPAWIPTFNPLKRLTASPKHHLVDPALAARLAGVSRQALLTGGTPRSAVPSTQTWLGALFESLVTQSARIYAEASDARVGHLRTRNTSHEIDLIVEGSDRRIVAIEVKLAATVQDKDARHLHWLKEQLGDLVADQVIVTTGERAYRRSDGVAVVPFALLGP